MATVTPPIEEGSRVRLSRELTDDERTWVHLAHGDQFTVDEYVPALEQPTEDEIPVAFYEGSDDCGCSIIVPADAIEVVKTAAQVAARKLPTPAELASAVAGELLGTFDDFELNEVDYGANDGTFEAYGKTTDGLGLGFQITISQPWKTDL